MTSHLPLTPEAIAADNPRRLALLREPYDPVRGIGCHGDRITVDTPVDGLPSARVPRSMVGDPLYAVASRAPQWRALRCRHDFEYWCVTAVRIKPKDGYRLTPFVLNRAQRKVLAALEDDRLAGRPIRLIILKARQWGCSTLILHYMAWIQMCIRPNWHSLICCHNKDSAVNIRRLYADLIRDCPRDLVTIEGEEREEREERKERGEGGKGGAKSAPGLQFRPFEGSANVREITGRDCRVAVLSSESQDATRGYDIAMAHLSETAYWRDTPSATPADLVRSVCGSVALLPYTLVVMESTANGMGNYFHDEWQRSKAGLGDKRPVFVAWFETELCSLPLGVPPADFAASLTERELHLWQLGCTLEQIHWYRRKSLADKDPRRLCAEYPSDDVEAFGATEAGVFDPADVDRLAAGCRRPARCCDIVGDRLFDRPGGQLEIWSEPIPGADYVVAVDVGGRSEGSDWSVVAVMMRGRNQPHEVVAQWRGHVDHDRLVDIARVIAGRYNEALLIIESNTLESESGSQGATSFVLQRLADSYPRLYRRRSSDPSAPSAQGAWRIGFHTNRATKALLVDGLIKAVRDGDYAERSAGAAAELSVYRQLPGGAWGAKRGYHDDMLITRALALHAISEALPSEPIPAPADLNRHRW